MMRFLRSPQLAGVLLCALLISAAADADSITEEALAPARNVGADVGHAVEVFLRDLDAMEVLLDSNSCIRAAVEGMTTVVSPPVEIVSGPWWHADGSNDVPCASLKAEELERGIWYLRADGLDMPCAGEVADRMDTWAKEGCEGIILDLRTAGGCALGCVEPVAGLFVRTNRVLFTVVDAKGTNVERCVVEGRSDPLGVPVVLLTDSHTSGSSELLAALLKGLDGVILVGRRTRGDSTVAEDIELPSGTVVRLRRRKVVPEGVADFEGVGVEPDVPIAENSCDSLDRLALLNEDEREESEGEREYVALQARSAGDLVLARAFDILVGIAATETDE